MMKLDRPLCIFDLEATGTDVNSDRIVDICVLRREPDGHAPVVVFCTVENDLEHITQALEAGADEYIMKPFDGDIIASKFEAVGLI